MRTRAHPAAAAAGACLVEAILGVRGGDSLLLESLERPLEQRDHPGS